MSTPPHLEQAHPLRRLVEGLVHEVGAARECSRVGMGTADKEAVLLGLARVAEQACALKLAVLAESDDVAEQHATRTPGAWLARETNHDPRDGRAESKLARALDSRWGLVREAFTDGRLNLAQVEAIVHALDGLPSEIDPDILTLAEAKLVELADDLGPAQLRRCGWRILELIAPDLVDERERQALERAEARARRQTSLSLRRTSAGMVRIVAEVPALHGELLKSQLHAFLNPRRDHLEGDRSQDDSATAASPDGVAPATAPDPVLPEGATRYDAATGERLPYRQLMGQAFCSLLERVDLSQLPMHGGSAASLTIHLDFDRLRADLQSATVAGGELPISPSEARRLACTSKLIPVVLGGRSEVLDYGRGRRLFSSAQRAAMAVNHPHCQADGCDIPAPWTEAHHLTPWEHGGASDLDNGVLLCSYHHHRIHDPGYRHRWHPDGSVTFHRRT